MGSKNKGNTRTFTSIFFVIVLIFVGIATCAALFFYIIGSIQKIFTHSQNVQKDKSGLTAKNCLADACLLVDGLNFPVGKINQDTRYTLIRALDQEYKKYATYKGIVEKFGSRRPFIMALRSEEEQTIKIKSLFDKYLLDIPENTYLVRDLNIPKDFREACRMAADVENTSNKLYENDLLPQVKKYEDIGYVFSNIMKTSSERYLPAFDHCD